MTDLSEVIKDVRERMYREILDQVSISDAELASAITEEIESRVCVLDLDYECPTLMEMIHEAIKSIRVRREK